jgi:hypothetical protein
MENEKFNTYSDAYDKVYEILHNDFNKFIQCFQVWVDVNRYNDEPIPVEEPHWQHFQFTDWRSLVNCVLENKQYTQYLFEFELP